MIKKIVFIIIVTLLITSCDQLLSFLISPSYYIPSFKVGWTVDMANSRIIGDLQYFNEHGNDENIWQFNWVPNTLLIPESGDTSSFLPKTGFPFEIQNYDNVESPFFYLLLLFKHDFGGSVGLDITAPVPVPSEQISIDYDNGSDIRPNYSMTVTNTLVGSYTLPEPAYLGIDGSGTTTELTGGLNVVDFTITADHDFVTGHATCVFSNTDPAGLLYIVYYHSNGLISVIYAHDVETTETGNYFPDGYYEYIWSVYKSD